MHCVAPALDTDDLGMLVAYVGEKPTERDLCDLHTGHGSDRELQFYIESEHDQVCTFLLKHNTSIYSSFSKQLPNLTLNVMSPSHCTTHVFSFLPVLSILFCFLSFVRFVVSVLSVFV